MKKNLRWSLGVMENIMKTVWFMLKRKQYFGAFKVQKDKNIKNWLKYINRVVDIMGQQLMFRIGEEPKNKKGVLYKINIEILGKVCDTGTETLL